MGFWSDFKKEVLDEMGEDWQEFKGEVAEIIEEETEAVTSEYEVEKHFNTFEKKFNKMLKAVEINKRIRKDVKKELSDLKKIALNEIKDKQRGGPRFPSRREKMFNKYGGRTAPEAVFKIASVLNDRYNYKQSNDAMWIDLNVDLFRVRALNDEELTALKRLEERAMSLKAERVTQKAKDLQQKVLNEEKYLIGVVQSTNPDNYKFKIFGGGKEAGTNFGNDYYDAKLLFEDKIALYKEEGRTDLLQAYNLCLKELRGEPDRVKTVILHLEKQLEPNKNLEERTQTAQVLREEPSKENKEEQTQYVDALREKLKKEKAARPAFDRSL